MNMRALWVGMVLAVAAVGLSTVAVAWACSPQATITNVSPGSGRAGDRVTVSAKSFTQAPVQLRWGSNTGPLIGIASGPSFSVAVTIPQSEPGVHMIVAVGPAGRASAPFEVVKPSESGGETTTPGGETTTPGGETTTPGDGKPAPGTSPPGSSPGSGTGSESTPGTGTSGSPGAATDGQTTTGGGSTDATTPGRSRSDRGPDDAGRDRSSGGVTNPAPGNVTMPSGREVFAGSVPGPATRAGTATSPTLTGPSETASAGRFWEAPLAIGGGADTTAQPATGRDSAVSSLGDPMLDGGGPAQSPLVIGVALFGLGLVAMFAGFLVAVVRRRRGPAEAEAERWPRG